MYIKPFLMWKFSCIVISTGNMHIHRYLKVNVAGINSFMSTLDVIMCKLQYGNTNSALHKFLNVYQAWVLPDPGLFEHIGCIGTLKLKLFPVGLWPTSFMILCIGAYLSFRIYAYTVCIRKQTFERIVFVATKKVSQLTEVVRRVTARVVLYLFNLWAYCCAYTIRITDRIPFPLVSTTLRLS